MSRGRARTAHILPHDYSEAELRAAHAALHAERRISTPFAVTMVDATWSHFVYCRALDLRRRSAARAPSGYVPANSTDIRRTFARARADAAHQQPLPLEETA